MPINVKDAINGSNFTGTVNGYSIAKSVPSNAVFTDTNTWRPVVDNLTSTATDQSLSANQGRVLKALVDGKAAASHGTHVTYGTSTTALTSGGTGVIGSSTTLARADHTHTLPAYPTALKSPGALTISLNGTSQGAYDGSAAKAINITASSIGAAASSHTHNYAASSSAGGAATSALACTGNSATATTLQTARTINGTSFNGSANITTANWGTARTITIGSTGKSVNGSGNVSWSLSEIGAAAASHGTHISDTGWQNLSLSSSVSLASGGVARYRKINNMVYVQMNVTGLSHAGGGATAVATTIATLPSGYRPSSYFPFDATCGATQPNPCRMECNTDGTIKFRSALDKMTTSYTLHIAFSFMI